jgi:FKBP-type peptidyl-prolyl cis-trans isomerase SlpA
MSQIERNSLVTIFYRLGLTNGDVLEDNFDDEPMTVQETIDIGPDLAFGYVEETLFRSIPRVEFDPELELEPGLIIEFATEEGETLPGTILDFNDDEVRVDLNHPLAGQTVRYSVKIVSIGDDQPAQTIH